MASRSPAKPASSPPAQAPSLQRIRKVASRLDIELAALYAAIPPEHRPISRLARWLGVNRSVCHRVFSASPGDAEPIETTLGRLPGVEGLRATLKALARKHIDPAKLARAVAAAEDYSALIGEAGGSQAKLVRRVRDLTAHDRADSAEHDHKAAFALKARRRHFESASDITGLRCEAYTLVYAVRRARAGDALEGAAILGMVGLRRRTGHMPISVARLAAQHPQSAAPTTLDGDPAIGWSPGAIIGRLSTPPLPQVSAARINTASVSLLDLPPAFPSPGDIYIGARFGVVAPTRDDPFLRISMIPRVPAARAIIDIYLHDDIGPVDALRSAAFYVGAEGAIRFNDNERWYDAIEPAPSVFAVGRGDAGSHTPHCPRHDDATRTLFDTAGWSASEFTHYRLETPYPLWGAQQFVRVGVRTPQA